MEVASTQCVLAAENLSQSAADAKTVAPASASTGRVLLLRTRADVRRMPIPSSSAMPGSGVATGGDGSVKESESIATNPRPGKPYKKPTPLTPESPKYTVLGQSSSYQVQPTILILLSQIIILPLGFPNEAIEISASAAQSAAGFLSPFLRLAGHVRFASTGSMSRQEALPPQRLLGSRQSPTANM